MNPLLTGYYAAETVAASSWRKNGKYERRHREQDLILCDHIVPRDDCTIEG